MTSQLITPNPNIPCKPGWCLQYVREAFGIPKGVYPTATAGWEASPTKHRDRDFPAGVWIPVWYALDTEPAGHVVLRAPDGSVYSTSDLTNVPHHHPDLADLEAYYAYYGMTLTYRGWTEDIENVAVVDGGTINYAGDIITPATPVQEDDLSDAQVERIINEINEANEAKHVATRAKIDAAVTSINWATQQQVEGVGRVTQQLIIDNASPADIAAQINAAGFAAAVRDELVKLIGGK